MPTPKLLLPLTDQVAGNSFIYDLFGIVPETDLGPETDHVLRDFPQLSH
jgi:hypothetical protein